MQTVSTHSTYFPEDDSHAFLHAKEHDRGEQVAGWELRPLHLRLQPSPRFVTQPGKIARLLQYDAPSLTN